MPLVPGDSRESVGKNISILRSEGKPPKQAIAIALNMAGKSKTASVEDLAGAIAVDPVKLAMWETMKASLRGPEQGTKTAQEELEKLAAPYDRAAGMLGALQGASIGGVFGARIGASNAHRRGEDVSQGALETGLTLAALGGLLGSTQGLSDDGYDIDKAPRLPSPGPRAADELFRGTKTAQEELEKLSFSLPNPFASKPPAPPPEDPHARRMRILQTLGPMDDWGAMSDAEMDAWQPSPMTPEAAAAYIAKYPDAPHMPAEGMPYTRRHSTELKTAQEELKKLAVSRAWIRDRVNAGLSTGVPKSRFKEVGARLYDSAPEGLKGSKKRYAADIAEQHGTARDVEKTASPWGSILKGTAMGGAAGAGIGALGAHMRGGDVGEAALKGGLGGAAGGAALGGLHSMFKNPPAGTAGWAQDKLAPSLIEKGLGAGLIGAGTLAGGAVTSAAFGDGIAEEMRAKEIGKFNAQQELLAQQRQTLAPKHQEAFQRAMADDTVQRAPQDIIHSAFETMRTFAPNLAADPNATLSFLRESAIYGTGPSYASIKSLADSEKSVVSAAKLAGANR